LNQRHACAERILSIANRIRLLGIEFNEFRIVEKNLVTILERFEAMSKITLAQLLISLQAKNKKGLYIREERFVEEALPSKHENGGRYKKNMNKAANICKEFLQK